MRQLQSNPLPKKLTTVRSLSASITATINTRLTMLGQLHAYPVPSHILAYARKYLAPTSLNNMKAGLLTLRDCSKYAAEALQSLRLAKLDRYQLEPGDLGTWIRSNAANHGYSHLTAEDLLFVSYLITSSEIQTTAWTLELHATPSENLIALFSSLYNNILAQLSATVSVTTNDDKETLKFSGLTEVPNYYVPTSDRDMLDLYSLVLPPDEARELYSRLKVLDDDKKATKLRDLGTQINREAVYYALSDLRLIDHLLCLLLDTTVWGSFVTPRSKIDAGQNDERMKGLELFASYLQSLLLYPHFFRYEMFKTGYHQLEAWHGAFPAIPAHIMEDYNNLIKAYDMLDAAADAKAIFAQYHTTADPNIHSELHVLFEESFVLYGAAELIAEVEGIPDISSFQLSDLAKFKDTKYDTILLALPLKRFAMLDTVQRKMAANDSFTSLTRETVRYLTPGYSRFLTAENMSKLTALSPRVPFGWHAFISSTPSAARGTYPLATGGSVSVRYWAPWATAANDRTLQVEDLFTVGDAKTFSAARLPQCIVDSHVSTVYREQYQRSWRTLYPANLMPGAQARAVKTFFSDTMELKVLFEALTGNHYETLRRLVSNTVTQVDFATYFSSFCLLYVKSADMKAAVLIAGENTPYGLSYSELEALQNFDSDTDLHNLPDTDIYVAFLKKVILPSADMRIGSGPLNKPYYYYPGTGSELEVTHLVVADSMQHFALRPLLTITTPKSVAFDKMSAFTTNHVFIQMDPGATLQTNHDAHEAFSFPVETKEWRGDKVIALLDYKILGKYSGGGMDLAQASAGEESTVENKLITEMNLSLQQLEKDSKGQTNITDDKIASLEGDITTSLGKAGKESSVDSAGGLGARKKGGAPSSKSHSSPKPVEDKGDNDSAEG